jgi:hypothetical protein
MLFLQKLTLIMRTGGQLKNPQRGFATTSVVKKKDPEPEEDKEAAKDSNSNSAIALSTENGTASTAVNGITSNSTNTAQGSSWDDSEEQKEAEDKLAFAERVKAASEKEAARSMKVLEYEKRMASSYPEFRWDDPLHLVSSMLFHENGKARQLSTFGIHSETKLFNWLLKKKTRNRSNQLRMMKRSL